MEDLHWPGGLMCRMELGQERNWRSTPTPLMSGKGRNVQQIQEEGFI